MKRSKKLIVGAVLAVVIIAGSIGGAVLAADNGCNSQPEAHFATLLDRVCEIYNANTDPDIDCDALKEAFSEAQGEIRAAATEGYLQRLVEEGMIDDAQAEELREWWESRPDMPMKFGFGGRGGFPGHGGFRGFDGPCAPAE